jgi:hypothetical protein
VEGKMPAISDVGSREVSELFSTRASELHTKVDATRDAYLGFIFPIGRSDFREVSEIFGLKHEVAQTLYREGSAFSTFRPSDGHGHLTNHIIGASFLALRGKGLNDGLSAVDDKNLSSLIKNNERVVLEVAQARSSWFGRIYFPSVAFANAIQVFGGKVTAEALYDAAKPYGYAATAGNRKTIRGDFGIGVWLMLLGFAP